MTVKVAMVGTHGTGKTTSTLHAGAHFKKQGTNLRLVTETARQCPLPINQEATTETMRWIAVTQIARETEAEHHSPELIISDRSVLDAYAYQLANCGQNRYIESVVENWLPTYDLLLHHPPRNEYLVDNGTRSTDTEFRNLVHEKICGLIQDKIFSKPDSELVELPTVFTETETEEIVNHIDFDLKH